MTEAQRGSIMHPQSQLVVGRNRTLTKPVPRASAGYRDAGNGLAWEALPSHSSGALLGAECVSSSELSTILAQEVCLSDLCSSSCGFLWIVGARIAPAGNMDYNSCV